MPRYDNCPVCRTRCEGRGIGPLHQKYDFDCLVCGPYRITTDAISEVGNLSPSDRGRISGALRDRSSAGQPVELWKAQVLPLLSSTPANILDKLDQLLLNLSKITEWFGQPIPLDPTSMSLGYTVNVLEFEAQIRNLVERGLIQREHRTGADPTIVSLTAEGLTRTNELRATRGWESNRVFLAMWFSEKMTETYEDGLRAGIESAGFEPMRVDRIEHNDIIDDLIVAGLKECKFVVADYTDHRNGVYYEAGFAHGMGKTVIMCCREEDKGEIHFDVNHRNFILYTSPQELAEKLKLRILATVGRGANFKTSD